ncbi:MAG: hypothetical protein AAGD08_11315 [Pseudomonadota bacterium]
MKIDVVLGAGVPLLLLGMISYIRIRRGRVEFYAADLLAVFIAFNVTIVNSPEIISSLGNTKDPKTIQAIASIMVIVTIVALVICLDLERGYPKRGDQFSARLDLDAQGRIGAFVNFVLAIMLSSLNIFFYVGRF